MRGPSANRRPPARGRKGGESVGGSAPAARQRQRGFTLVELMVVVAIIAVLAVIAIVAYRAILSSSKVAEAQTVVQSIRAAQESYHAETLAYANVSSSPTATYPAAAPGQFKTQWGAPCGSQCNTTPTWADLGVHVDGPVQFGYVTTAGAAGVAANPASIVMTGRTVALPTKPTTDWFYIAATADLDGNGGTPFGAGNTNVYATSWSNEVWVDNDGQ